MFKKALNVGSIALVLVTLLIFAGCPDVVDDPIDNSGSTLTVTLAPGSQGTGGSGAVTDLTTGSKYLVEHNGKWRAVGTDGVVKDEEDDIKDAITATAILPSGTITGLENGATYTVYRYQPGTISITLDQYNSIIDIAALTTAPGTITLTKTSGVGGTVILYTDQANKAYFSVRPVKPDLVFGNAASGLKYTFGTGTAAAGATITAAEDAKYVTLKLSSLTASLSIPIAVATSTAITELVSGDSQGAVGDGKIDTLSSGSKYVVYNATLDTWHAVKADGTLAIERPDLAGAIDTPPVALTVAPPTITGLINGFTYNVFVYDAPSTSVDINTYGGNGIIDISALTGSIQITSTSAPGPETVYVYTDDLNTAANATTAAITITNNEVFGGTAKTYTLGLTQADNVTITIPEAKPYAIFDFSGAIAGDCDFTITP